MYHILYENPKEDIFTRLMKIRNIGDNLESFLNPTFTNYWIDPNKLNDMDKAVKRISKAIKNHEKIMIFGDYDVDGVSSSYLLYIFFTKFLNYKKISIRLPNRMEDGYGIKNYHIDEINSQGVNLLITVDNGITAIEEAKYTKKLGIDMIITDHHKPLDSIPKAYAVINPQTSPEYPFKGIAGVGVAFKLAIALMNKFVDDPIKKKQIYTYLMPIVTIGTVADCVPLIDENRLLVKQGLNIINTRKDIPLSIINMLDYLNIKGKIDTFHIGFQIAPRLNAGGRIQTPYDSLYALIHEDKLKQKQYLDKLEIHNNSRKKLQEDSFKLAETQIDIKQNIMIAGSENFHEGVIGIVAGKISDKYNTPSIVFNINKKNGLAIGSLRGPEYFSVIDLLYELAPLLERYGGHKQAGGMTLKLNKIDQVINMAYDYCKMKIKDEDKIRTIKVDTVIYEHELDGKKLSDIDKFGPYGEGNPEPNFLIKNIIIGHAEKVGKNGNGHLKVYAQKGDKEFPVLFWGKGNTLDDIERNCKKDLIGKIKKDDFNGGFYINGITLI